MDVSALFSAQTQAEFMVAAHGWYEYRSKATLLERTIYGHSSDRLFGHRYGLLFSVTRAHECKAWMYCLGRDRGVLRMSFDQFEQTLQDRYTPPRWPKERPWWVHRSLGYRVAPSFIQHGCAPKQAADNLWKEVKKAPRHPWRHYMKKVATQKHRMHEKRLLAKERYDDLDTQSYKRATKRFYWD
jgi:hypothetical protein